MISAFQDYCVLERRAEEVKKKGVVNETSWDEGITIDMRRRG